jgi:hypothetical protein
MATYSKHLLSASTNGKHIVVTQSDGTGTIIHEAVAGTSSMDEVWLYATNTSAASSANLTILWGEGGTPGYIEISLTPESGYTLIVPGLIVQNGLTVSAVTNLPHHVNINGYVNRIV